MDETDDVAAPPGVKLTSWDDFPARRAAIFDEVKAATDKAWPQTYNGVRLELHNTHYVDPEQYSRKDFKDALMQNKFLHRRLRGTWKLFDDKSGDLLDEKEATVMKVPYLTDHGTFLHNGSEITTISQARLMPGVYTRRKSNGELEAHFNAKRGTGSSFRVRLEPESGLFKLDVNQSSLRLYSLLHDIGVPDEALEKKWGPELLAKNKAAYDSRVLDKAYARLVRRPDPNHTQEDKVKAIKEALAAAKVSREVVSRTLPNMFVNAGK